MLINFWTQVCDRLVFTFPLFDQIKKQNSADVDDVKTLEKYLLLTIFLVITFYNFIL